MGTREKPGQVQRFHAIVKNADRNPVAVKTWLKTRYGYDSSAEIKRCDYDAICEAIAASGPLPLESGSDDAWLNARHGYDSRKDIDVMREMIAASESREPGSDDA
jgi:hypothetical protein